MSTYGPALMPQMLFSNADLQQVAQTIHNALIACGLVQTADTGQANLSTMVWPAGTSAAAGYEIWRLNDALQASTPVFIKIEYGTGFQNRNAPGIWLTTGSTTNGAGTLGGDLTTRRAATWGGSSGGGLTGGQYYSPLFASGDGSRFSMAFGATMGGQGAVLLGVERTRDVNGNNLNAGVTSLCAQYGSAGSFFNAVPTGYGSALSATHGPCIPVNAAANIVGGQPGFDNIAIGTMVYFLGLAYYGISWVLIPARAAAQQFATFTATVLGATHTYLVLLGPYNYTQSPMAMNYESGSLECMLWE